jgi:hypothetical protein
MFTRLHRSKPLQKKSFRRQRDSNRKIGGAPMTDVDTTAAVMLVELDEEMNAK